MNKSQIIKFFTSLRNKELSSDELLDMLIERIKQLDEDKILKFQLELNNYLTKEKELMRNKFSDEEINKAILNRIENNKPIPHRGGLGNNTKENSFLYLDIEALKFPNEFKCLYELQKLFNAFPYDKLKKTHKKFIEFFNPASSIDDNKLKWLKDVFNQNQSQKEYAIMFCLLSQNKLITVRDKELKSLFIAWYDYIELSYPKSYGNLYLYIDDKSYDGLLFKNPNDSRFRELENKLINEFI